MNARWKHVGEYVPSYMKSLTQLHLLMVVVCIAMLAVLETMNGATEDGTVSTHIALVIGPDLHSVFRTASGLRRYWQPKSNRWNTRLGWVMMVLTVCMIGAGFVIGYGEPIRWAG